LGAADESVKNEGESYRADVTSVSGSDSDHSCSSPTSMPRGVDDAPRPSTSPQGLQTPLAGRPAFSAERLAGFVSGDVGLKPPDVPKAMALAHAEYVEDPHDFFELVLVGWVPSTAAGFADLSFLGRHRFEQWVQSARADVRGRRPGDDHGGRSNALHTARAAAPQPKWAGAPQRELPHAPAQDPNELGDHAAWADAGDGEARVRFTSVLCIVLTLQNCDFVAA